MELSFFILALFATTIGAISGMGGGIIIKPVLDAVSGLPVDAISFMSSCTVLAMSLVSTWRSRKENWSFHLPLAFGAALGGIFGKNLFLFFPGNRALVQSTVLFFLYLGIFLYVKNKDKFRPLYIKKRAVSLLIGLILGAMASFLSIGGGAMNMAVLLFFLGSPPKVAAKQSLFIILLSQLTSFFTTIITGIPVVDPISLVLMMIGGCYGAILGGKISKKFSHEQVKTFFLYTLIGVIFLSFWNLLSFGWHV